MSILVNIIMGEHMAKEILDQTRRVYVLPADLVQRIVEFQEAEGLPSEVEAARRLLDEALNVRENHIQLLTRLLRLLKEQKSIFEVSKRVLFGHPLVSEISPGGEAVDFTVKGKYKYTIPANGEIWYFEYNADAEPTIQEIKDEKDLIVHRAYILKREFSQRKSEDHGR